MADMNKQMEEIRNEFVLGGTRMEQYVHIARETIRRTKNQMPTQNPALIQDLAIDAAFAMYCKDVYGDDGTLCRACSNDFLTHAFVSEGFKKRLANT